MADQYHKRRGESSHLRIAVGIRIPKIAGTGHADEIKRLIYLFSTSEAATYLLLSRQSVKPEWVERINTAIKEVIADGSYEKIISRYIVK